MANITQYIKDYGDISFVDKPFNDADNIAMCGMYYMPLEKAVSDSFDDEPIPYKQVSDKVFELRGFKHTPVGLVLLKNISEQMVEMAKYKRYAEMKVVACTRVYQKEPAVQFEAATFLLPDKTIVVLFKGTDDTLTGWKEDLDILTQKSIPSNKYSTQYLEKVADKFDGDIIICGHSKGGFIAQYAAMYCSDKVKARIKCFYNNDGPGFWDYEYLNSSEYAQMLPKYKHFVPQSSFIGMLLAHDYDYTVVKSDKILGPLQHDLASWQIKGDKLEIAEELTPMGKINDLVFKELVENLTPEQEKVLDKVVGTVVNGVEQEGLLDVAGNIGETIKKGKAALDSVDKETKKEFLKIFKPVPKIVYNKQRDVQTEVYRSINENIKDTLKYINVLF